MFCMARPSLRRITPQKAQCSFTKEYGVSQNAGPYTKAQNILVSLLGSPYFGKLPDTLDGTKIFARFWVYSLIKGTSSLNLEGFASQLLNPTRYLDDLLTE